MEESFTGIQSSSISPSQNKETPKASVFLTRIFCTAGFQISVRVPSSINTGLSHSVRALMISVTFTPGGHWDVSFNFESESFHKYSRAVQSIILRWHNSLLALYYCHLHFRCLRGLKYTLDGQSPKLWGLMCGSFVLYVEFRG